ncbi:PIN domain-containing protein [Desulfurivibrio dismutans]|uniref:PIN domain-containing protein n=1 Tax=Desulfurivibrio dismutans TaxID=1398908 RepID=UPI0023DB94B9|nr:PIN domain-containing protein [Desulfurivibrio alkaliphilus]MDF1615662.1 PIN domain-containing protein [Desulfurivibrio alkaliphilus]
MTGKADSLPDTNVVLRYLLRDDPEQFAKVETFFEEVRTGTRRALFMEGVLLECLYVLTKYYQVPRQEAARALSDLLLYKGIVNPNKAILADGLNYFATSNLDPVDCFLLAKSRIDKLPIFSFDKALNKASRK